MAATTQLPIRVRSLLLRAVHSVRDKIIASSGNRTRVTSMATTYSTTRPMMHSKSGLTFSFLSMLILVLNPIHAGTRSRACLAYVNREAVGGGRARSCRRLREPSPGRIPGSTAPLEPYVKWAVNPHLRIVFYVCRSVVRFRGLGTGRQNSALGGCAFRLTRGP